MNEFGVTFNVRSLLFTHPFSDSFLLVTTSHTNHAKIDPLHPLYNKAYFGPTCTTRVLDHTPREVLDLKHHITGPNVDSITRIQ